MEAGLKPRNVVGRETRSASTCTGLAYSKGKEKVDQEVQGIFNEWVETCGKAYGSDKDRDEYFQIFLSAKEFIEQHNSLNRFEVLGLNNNDSALSLNKSADKKESKRQFRSYMLPLGHPSMVGRHVPDHTLEMNNEELKEAEAEFERWAAAYGKVYVSEEDRKKRFLIFLDKKRRLVPPGLGDADFWTYKNGHHWEILDLMWWESGLPKNAAAHTCKCDEFCDYGELCECDGWCKCEDECGCGD